MNIMHKLTISHLKHNKKRTLVTIIGVIISVAMVTAVATLGVSFMELMQKQVIATRGEWHVFYQNVDKEQLEVIKSDEATKEFVITRDLGHAPLEKGQNRFKPYIFIKEYNSKGFQQFPIELKNGRFPQAENEVVISEEIFDNPKVDYQIGDKLTLNIGERIIIEGEAGGKTLGKNDPLKLKEQGERAETLKTKLTKTYTVVGFIERPHWEPAWAPGYTVISFVDESSLSPGEKVDVQVVVNKVQRSLYNHAKELAEKNDIEKPAFNNELLRFYGVTNNDNLRSTLYSLSAILMAVIVIGSVALIYNAFAISVSERSRHLGMLSSVGATRRQKRNSVFFEGAIIGLISIPLGIICGLVGIGVTFWFINPLIQGAMGVTERLTVSITPLSILITCVISMLTIFISAYLPAQKASKISAIDAIRQTMDIKLNGKTVKTFKFIRKFFGIEAEIGLKNLKRNKGRYQATVFSLVISIVLFLAVSFFTANLVKSIELSQDGVNYDISVYMGNEYTQTDKGLIKSIVNLKDVTDYNVIQQLDMSSWIDKDLLAKELQEEVKEDESLLDNRKYPYYLRIHVLDEESLKDYAQKVGADFEQLQNPEKLAGIVIDTTKYEDGQAGKFVETKAINTGIGENIDLFYYDSEKEEEIFLNQLEIAALTEQLPMGVFSSLGLGGLNIIISENVLEKLIEDKENLDVTTYLFLKSSKPLETQRQIEDIVERDMYITNLYQIRQQEEQMILLMSVFTYGFIVLITAISIANIFNTISTSIALRKREFAILRSVGMTPKGFNKMLNYESIFYGVKALFYGLPISIVVMYLIYRSLMYTFSFGFELPWISIGYVIAAVFVIVASAMLYSSIKIKNENIIDALKQENI